MLVCIYPCYTALWCSTINVMTMENVAKSIEIADPELRFAYLKLCDDLDQVAKVAIGSRYVSAALPFVTFDDDQVRLSDFSDGYTTIVDVTELNAYLNSGEYEEIVRRQCVVSICAFIEGFVSALFQVTGLSENDGEQYGKFPNDFSLHIHNGNKVLRKIYYIFRNLNFSQSNLENVQSARMLDEMFTIRHVIVHFNGKVIKDAHKERISGAFIARDGQIKLDENSIDDFVHRVYINLRGFIIKIDDYVASRKSRS